MSDTSRFVDQLQDLALWEGLRRFSELPGWLRDARDPQKVGAALQALVPEFRSGTLRMEHCDIGHIRYKKDNWAGLYEVTTRGPNGAEPVTVILQGYIYPPDANMAVEPQVEGRFGEHGWHAELPEINLELKIQEPETVLSAMEFLTDPQQAAAFLAANMEQTSPEFQGVKIESCRPRIVRYKPGSRCTIVYHLDYAADSSRNRSLPEMVVAKTYRGEKGQNAFDSMLALWRSPLGSGSVVTVAEPLAYQAESRVLIQGPIAEEQTLKEMIISAIASPDPQAMQELEVYLRKTAAGLAALHQSDVRMGRTWTWHDELAEVQDRIDRLSGVLPDLKKAAVPLLERLQTLEADRPADGLVPTHGSFRPAQVLIAKGQVGFIDFDSFCQSEPANDIALFLSTVMSLGLTTADFDSAQDDQLMDDATRTARYDEMTRLSNLFLDEYEKSLPISRERVALWETLDIFMLVLHGWIKIKTNELANIMYLLERFIQTNRFVEAR